MGARTRSQYRSGIQTFFDDQQSFETVHPMAGYSFREDFDQKAIDSTNLWTLIDVSTTGNSTPILAADAASGVLRCPLDATSEAQESGVTRGDQRVLVLNQGLIIEYALALQTLPTSLGIAVWGLAGDKNAVANTVAESIWFRADGSGAVTVETDDTVNETSLVATGTTLTAGTQAIFRIDCSVTTSVKFFINGNRVAGTTTFNMSTVPTLKLQPYVHIAKASGTGVGTVDVDCIRAWQRRIA